MSIKTGMLFNTSSRTERLLQRIEIQQLRRARAEEESIPLQPYTSLDQIRGELSYMDALCRKHQWQRVDATGKSVEEVAREIIGILEEEKREQTRGNR